MRGRPRKPVEDHLLEGTFRADRHAERVAEELPQLLVASRDRKAEPITSEEITRAWVRNPSDEAAVASGCRFNLYPALFGVWWIERYCRLY